MIESASRHVFTYGSLMYPSVWTAVVQGQYASQRALLQGFRRHSVRDETYPAALRDADAQITGQLYRDVDADDLALLDLFEGSDYERITVPVQLIDAEGRLGERIEAELYLYLLQERLDAKDWDPEWFETEGILAFSARYRPVRG